ARIEQADVQRIARTMADSEQPQAQRIARKLLDYSSEAAEIESLRREVAKLEAAQRERVALKQSRSQRDQDLRAAAVELREILRDEEDALAALLEIQDMDARHILRAIGIAIH
ncbi:MAG: hypothetical protein ACK5X3_22110, partial [Pseudomonadota bacterium]